MRTIHRENTAERQHFVPQGKQRLTLKPELLYAGKLTKSPHWSDKNHRHEFCELMLVTSGSGEIRTGGKSLRVGRGDLVIYNRGCVHSERSLAHDPMEMLFLGLRNIRIEGLEEECLLKDGNHCVIPAGQELEELESLILRIVRETDARGFYHAELAQAALTMVLLTVFRLLSTGGTPYADISDSYALAKKYIDENYTEDISLSKICKELFINKYYLTHRFKEACGQTVTNYIIQKRMSRAKELLSKTSLGVGEIAAQVGYDDACYFSRVFKKNAGIPPAQYRRSNSD